MQILSVVLRAPRFRPTSGKSWFSWRERPKHLCMSLMRVRSLLLDIPPLHSPFPSYQMQNFLLMQKTHDLHFNRWTSWVVLAFKGVRDVWWNNKQSFLTALSTNKFPFKLLPLTGEDLIDVNNSCMWIVIGVGSGKSCTYCLQGAHLIVSKGAQCPLMRRESARWPTTA